MFRNPFRNRSIAFFFIVFKLKPQIKRRSTSCTRISKKTNIFWRKKCWRTQFGFEKKKKKKILSLLICNGCATISSSRKTSTWESQDSSSDQRVSAALKWFGFAQTQFGWLWKLAENLIYFLNGRPVVIRPAAVVPKPERGKPLFFSLLLSDCGNIRSLMIAIFNSRC